ncbi:class I SAM-dependent methyltransferase [Gilvimarinus sp. 1_MG-2023]|uniref:class I SAM-dependent methyltransferase n=1 Tax=Gilvimarinus sp. 1_MG-2023 TaxID=3062638 RepID=UPI0026E26BE4|nr:class I SAM-dependent methyltransferase [Gilvimarinus sp. 1_MG-2023]MDO6747966.1 class I SAM-dependent methyltransferase [Gilvimarinus sp. 1_MG-2023]
MQNTITQTKLPADFTSALYSHAMADHLWPELRLYDKAARELWERLPTSTHRVRAQKTQITRSLWYDQRCLEFIRLHPSATFIALEAGLNTRFHRLSQQAEWPRFQWWELDRPERAACKQRLLPRVDNYRIEPLCPRDIAGQLQAILYTQARPVMIICEAANSHFTQPQWYNLLSALKPATTCQPIELIFDCPNRIFLPFGRRRALTGSMALPAHARVLRQDTLQQPLASLMTGRQQGWHLSLASGRGHRHDTSSLT